MNNTTQYYPLPQHRYSMPKSDATNEELFAYANAVAIGTGKKEGVVLYVQLSKIEGTTGKVQPDLAIVHFSMKGIPFRVDRFNIPKLLEERRKFYFLDLWKGNV